MRTAWVRTCTKLAEKVGPCCDTLFLSVLLRVRGVIPYLPVLSVTANARLAMGKFLISFFPVVPWALGSPSLSSNLLNMSDPILSYLDFFHLSPVPLLDMVVEDSMVSAESASITVEPPRIVYGHAPWLSSIFPHISTGQPSFACSVLESHG